MEKSKALREGTNTLLKFHSSYSFFFVNFLKIALALPKMRPFRWEENEFGQKYSFSKFSLLHLYILPSENYTTQK